MKKLAVLLTIAIFSCGCTPSQDIIQTALAETQSAWTPIPSLPVTPTLLPTLTLTPTLAITATPVPVTSDTVLLAFREAGLEAENARSMSKGDYGHAPYVCQGTLFYIPAICLDCTGSIFICSNEDDLNSLQSYYQELGRSSKAALDWIFVKDNVLVIINGGLPEDIAQKYESAIP